MKRLGKIAVCLLSGLVLNAGARADDGVLPNNPYAPIVTRNVFSLNPPPPEVPPQQADPPPKITPNGIMSIFGQLQVLFKVANPAKPGQPAKEDSYILSEGQRQDEIEVVKIDEKNSLVTFNNHGAVQELPLAKANATAGTSPGPGKPPGQIPGRFGGHPAGGPGAAARNRGAGNSSNGMGGGPQMGGGSALAAALTSIGSSSQTSQNSQGELTPEEQAVLLETQREVWKQQGNPASVLIPPTMLTPRNNAGGAPPTP